jgi:hypothetical protein
MTAGRNAVLNSSKCLRPFSLSCPPTPSISTHVHKSRKN